MSKTLIAYFPAQGSTAKLARTLAAAAGASLYEIRPAIPYERRDLKKRPARPVEEPAILDLTFSTTAAKPMDKVLFERLRDVRKALATAGHIAPYMVFSDKSLQAMATEMPTTQAEFGILYGVGAVKCQKYWRPFTAAIRDYLNDNK